MSTQTSKQVYIPFQYIRARRIDAVDANDVTDARYGRHGLLTGWLLTGWLPTGLGSIPEK